MKDKTSLEPLFLGDDYQGYDLPPMPTVTNSWALYGLQEGETVAEAIARSEQRTTADAWFNRRLAGS